VPGLLGIILTMTMVLMTSMALTRERERGTYENLLAMPTTPIEIMIGKILPNIAVGLIQATIVLLVAGFVFGVPMVGSLWLLFAVTVLFIAANLAVGYTFSTVAQNQLQAMQMMVFFLLPAILLSGFAFPFRGMPVWAQWIGEALPVDAFPQGGPRHFAQGQRPGGDLAGRLAPADLHGSGGNFGPFALPPDAGLRLFCKPC